eukprot:1393661-Amorphochlora_amoeboformis.AAC.1
MPETDEQKAQDLAKRILAAKLSEVDRKRITDLLNEAKEKWSRGCCRGHEEIIHCDDVSKLHIFALGSCCGLSGSIVKIDLVNQAEGQVVNPIDVQGDSKTGKIGARP